MRGRILALVNGVRADNGVERAGTGNDDGQDLSDLDSFSLLELSLVLEDEFSVSFDSFEFHDQTLDEVVEYIVANTGHVVRAEGERFN